MAGLSKKLGARLAALTIATVGLSGCMYGEGYYGDSYGYNYYDCDPYAPFDSYYACDSGYGFYNIGFGGGWYDNYWYPGYGYYVFDHRGYRFNMRDHHRRYWGDRRQRWYREHHGRDGRRDGDGRRGRHGYGYNGPDNGVDQPIAWPERDGGRRGARPGREAGPTPPPPLGGDDNTRDRDGRHFDDGRGRGDGDGGRGGGRRGEWRGGNAGAAPVADTPPPPVARPPRERGGDNPGRGAGRWEQPSGNGQQSGSYQPPAPRSAPQQPAPRSAPPAPRTPPPSREVPDRLPD